MRAFPQPRYVLASLLLGLVPPHAPAATFTIPNGNVTALKSAINTANANGESDVINLAFGGTYSLTGVDNFLAGANGLPVITDDIFFSGRGTELTIQGNNATIRRSTASSTPRFRVLQIAGGASVVMNNLLISGGNVQAAGIGPGGGGGIYSSQSTLTLTRCSFSGNSAQGALGADGTPGFTSGDPGHAGFGGGLYSSGGSVNAAACTFTDNIGRGGPGGSSNPFGFTGKGGNGGSGSGGGVAGLNAIITLTDCTFAGNLAIGGIGGFGSTGDGNAGLGSAGALYTALNATVARCSFTNNSADAAGAVQNTGTGLLALSDSTFTGNTATVDAGAIDNCSPAGSLTLVGCTLTGNSASLRDGGGLVNFGPTTISQCTFDNNSAPNGGAIFNRFGTITLTSSTFVNNSATSPPGSYEFRGGGGIYNSHELSVTNCTFSQNSSVTKGGAIFNGRGTVNNDNLSLLLTNSTLSANTAAVGGGVYFAAGGSLSGGILTNSVFKTGASGANIANGGLGTVASQGHNLSNDHGGGFLVATGDQINTDPQLSPLSSNGGFTQTHALQPGSPASDSGNDAKAPHRDQRGYLRNGRSDIGAFEFAANLLGSVSMTRSNNDVIVSCEVVAGRGYRLERKFSLTDPSWQNLGPIVPDLIATGNDTETITDPNGFLLGRGFYRVSVLP